MALSSFCIGPPPATTSFMTNTVRRALPATATSPTTMASRSIAVDSLSRFSSGTRAHQRRRGAATRGQPLPTPNPCRDRTDKQGTSRKRAESRPAPQESEMAGTLITWVPGIRGLFSFGPRGLRPEKPRTAKTADPSADREGATAPSGDGKPSPYIHHYQRIAGL